MDISSLIRLSGDFMQAVVLAAGEGQRLRPFTANKPKVMIKVANKPILEYVIEALKNAGIHDIVLVVGYKRSRIIDYFGSGEKWGVKIRYAVQEQQLGTAHALKQAEKFVESDELIVVSGDNIFDSKTVEMLKEPWMMAFKKSDEPTKYGIVVTKNGVVEEILEKPKEAVGNLVNVGIYRFGREIFREIDGELDLVSVINKMIKKGYTFRCVEAQLWMDIVYPWDILKVNDLVMNFTGKIIGGVVKGAKIIGNVIVGKGSIIEAGAVIEGPVIIGDYCRIGANSVIRGSTSIGDGCTIGALSYIENSVIGENVSIGSGACIVDSVIDRGCRIDPKFTAISDVAKIKVDNIHSIKFGAFIGEMCEIGSGVVAEAGAIIGNKVKVKPLKTLRESIPDCSLIV